MQMVSEWTSSGSPRRAARNFSLMPTIGLSRY
jgi:hypothetical protein